MYNPFSLSGKTILVTGAFSGIGQATTIGVRSNLDQIWNTKSRKIL